MKEKTIAIIIILMIIKFSIVSEATANVIIEEIKPVNYAVIEYNPTLEINVSTDKSIDLLWIFSNNNKLDIIGKNLSVTSGIYRQKIPNGTQEGMYYQWGVIIFDSENYYNYTYSFKRRGWNTIDSGSFLFKGYITGGNISLDNVRPVFPPPEGNGIEKYNKSELDTLDNIIVFSLDLISVPELGKYPQWGEYYIEDERILGIKFIIEDISTNYSNIENVILSFSVQDNVTIQSFNLDLNNNISDVITPIILNKSGLWNIRLDFIVKDKNLRLNAFENISKFNKFDDGDYITFYLTNNSSLNYVNYYEKYVPVHTFAEVGIFQQIDIGNIQTELMNISAISMENATETFKDSVSRSGISLYIQFAMLLTTAILVFFTIWFNLQTEKKRDKRETTNEWKNAYREIGAHYHEVNPRKLTISELRGYISNHSSK